MKMEIFFIPPAFNAPVKGGGATMFSVEKLEWCAYPIVKKSDDTLHHFKNNTSMWQTDRRMDGQTDGQIDILRRQCPRYAWWCAVKVNEFQQKFL